MQWLTAGGGIVHSEMFPLLRPRRSRTRSSCSRSGSTCRAPTSWPPPHFTMLWADDVPRCVETDDGGRRTEVTVVAGRLGELSPPAPPPRSWARRPDTDVAIWTLRMEPGARFDAARLPRQAATAGSTSSPARGCASPAATCRRRARSTCSPTPRRRSPTARRAAELLLLQGRPIGEPVAQHGPFVMNTHGRDRSRPSRTTGARSSAAGRGRATRPCTATAPDRFARHPDGRVERPSGV